jgi:hypothetical protein
VEELIKSQTWWLSIAILVSAWIITSAVHRAAARIFDAVVTFRTTLSSELSSLAACVVVAGLDAGEEIGMWRIGPGARRVRRDAKRENGRTKRPASAERGSDACYTAPYRANICLLHQR